MLAISHTQPHTLMSTQVKDLGSESDSSREQAATLLVQHFDEPRGWPDLKSARDEVAHVLREGFALAALDGVNLLGWVGGLPEYHGRVWELHPMVVHREHRRRGIGRALVSAFESGVADRGGLTVTLGTDDDSGMTSLAGIDLYTNLPNHIAELRDLGRGHPFEFYRKLGFVVTGVMPDANGRGFPDIYMSKPIGQ
jgi:aminoglycoside 6'-N-acetyltransferase I